MKDKKNTENKKENKEKKLFVPDTNVFLHEHTCIRKFGRHDVLILTTVLEELDNSKKWNDSIGFNAREFSRDLDELRKERITITVGSGVNATTKKVSALFNGGVSLGEGLGMLEVQASTRKLHPKVKDLFFDEIPDNRILSKVFELQNLDKKKRTVILVTKDINLRLKAEALGIRVEDYKNDKVLNLDSLYTGKGEIFGDELAALIDTIHTTGSAPIFDQEYSSKIPQGIKPNMYFTLKGQGKNALVCVDKNKENFLKVEKQKVFGITPRNAEQVFAVDAIMRPGNKLVTLLGKAGTGKTLLAMAAALQLYQDMPFFEKIVLSAAMIPLSNRDIGALPGDANEKVAPYMQGLYDNLEFIKSQHKGKKVFNHRVFPTEKTSFSKKKKSNQPNEVLSEEKDFISTLQTEGKIQIQPLASIRGRSLNNVVFVIDEAQNLSPHEVKTIVTRAGENTIIIFCGDVRQIDSPYLDACSNGLTYLIDRMSGNKIVTHVTLEKGERSELAELAADLL